MDIGIISAHDVLARVIDANYRVLVVLDRMGIKLGMGSKTIEVVTREYDIETGAFLIILNLFCNKKYIPDAGNKFEYIPDLLTYLNNSHRYFLEEKIPTIQQNIKQLVYLLHDLKAELVESFYNKYIEEVTEHINYENETVFPYIEQIFHAYQNRLSPGALSEEYGIRIYGEHHDDIEDKLTDLKHILIRYLPQLEQGKLRRTILQQLFELEADLFSHTRIENEVLIPLVNNLESRFRPIMNN